MSAKRVFYIIRVQSEKLKCCQLQYKICMFPLAFLWKTLDFEIVMAFITHYCLHRKRCVRTATSQGMWYMVINWVNEGAPLTCQKMAEKYLKCPSLLGRVRMVRSVFRTLLMGEMCGIPLWGLPIDFLNCSNWISFLPKIYPSILFQ